MPSLKVPPNRRRRRRGDDSDDEEQSTRQGTPLSQSSTGSKRPRLEDLADEGDHDQADLADQTQNGTEKDEDSSDDSGRRTNLDPVEAPRPVKALRDVYDGHDDFQPGAIVRIKLKDFVTYTSAEFFPGPKLNMVIGPNGTGKSTLVCAICLGLGWGPQVCLRQIFLVFPVLGTIHRGPVYTISRS
jgi:hypothetical protein